MDLLNQLTKQTKNSSGGAGGLEEILSQLGSFPSLIGPLTAMLSNGGLDKLLAAMKTAGLGDTVSSWIGKGPNKSITPDQAGKVLGKKKVQKLAADSGLPEDQVLNGVSSVLPSLVNHLTPDGSMPAVGEVETALGGLLKGFGL